MKKLKTLEQRVTAILTKNKKARDNSRILISKIWESDLGEWNILSFDDLLDGTLTHPDNITRIARKVKAENPHLRGTNYKVRKMDAIKAKTILKHKKK